MENKNQNAPKLTPEQAKKLKGMLNLSKYTRWVFFASILLGVMLSILSGVLKDTLGDAMLLICAGVFAIAAICAVIMFANVRRIKAYLWSLGIRVE